MKVKSAPYTVYFTNTQSEINLILHVSNFDTPTSPIINKRILFGTASAMTHHQLIVGLSLSTIVVMLIIFSLLAYLYICSSIENLSFYFSHLVFFCL